jgi:hypothetical protein
MFLKIENYLLVHVPSVLSRQFVYQTNYAYAARLNTTYVHVNAAKLAFHCWYLCSSKKTIAALHRSTKQQYRNKTWL